MQSTGRSAQLSGSIHQFSLPDIVQFLSAAEKTGKLALNGADGAGAIYFEKGIVIHASVKGSVGEEAFFELMRWHEGQFEFSPGESSDEKTVQQHGAILLMEGARRSDEWGLLSEEIPDTALIPEFVAPNENNAGKQVTLNTSEWMVLAKIDGQKSLKELAQHSGLSEYHVCRLFYPLLANGLIRLREPSP